MKTGTNNYRLKVVWLCHFANQEMKDHFHTPHVKEFAPWISNLIELFQDRTDIELHIVAPNIFTYNKQYVKIKNVHYHFFRITPNYIPRQVSFLFRIEPRTNYFFTKGRIRNTIRDINPDIIHLHGAENPYYSVGILPIIDMFPILVTIQGLIRIVSAREINTDQRIKIEEEIIRKSKHICVRTNEMRHIILEINPKAQLHFHNYPATMPVYIKDNSIVSTYDIAYFARICKDKGIEDLLEAVALIKKIKPDISLHVLGGGAEESYLRFLENKMKQLEIENNVKFLGFIETQHELHKQVSFAKICVLPTYADTVPGTIIESMFMKLPVIAYAVGGIPDLNNKGQAIVLVEKNNIQQLSNEIITLLENESKRNSIAAFAYNCALERYNNSAVVNDIVKAYNDILSASDSTNYN
jgi:glycosyltransferase involved in cell wall biosynthesis